MLNMDKIFDAVAPHGGVGVAALHETGHPSVIFTTDCGKVYRVDFIQAPDDEHCTRIAKAIEDATGLKVDWYGPTRTQPERDKAVAAAEATSRKAAAEAAKNDPPPVKVQTAAEAERESRLKFHGIPPG